MMTKMPFGRYCGCLLSDLPDSYLRWLTGLDTLREPLRSAVFAEWDRRAQAEAPPAQASPALPADLRSVVLDIVSAGFKTLAVKRHPDCGGSHSAMIELVQARDWLKAWVSE